MGAEDSAIIRPVRATDAAALSVLALRSKGYWGYSPAFLEACREELTVDAGYIRRNRVFALDRQGAVIGYYALGHAGPGQAELLAIFVEPGLIGRGFGRTMMAHAKEQAAAMGCTSIIVQGDPNAGPFYRASGGVLCGSRESMSIPGRMLPLFRIPIAAAG